MRVFTVRKGSYVGEHKIFEGEEEATRNGIKDIKKPWFDPSVEPGFWVVSDDGYVVQCLARHRLVNKRHRQGQYTDVLRFPMGISWVYHGKNGGTSMKSCNAGVTNFSKNSLGNTNSLGKYMTAKKKLFVAYVSEGLDPYYAFRKVWNKWMAPPAAVFAQVNRLLNDKLVREALMEKMEPFMKMVTEKIKEKTGHTDLLEYIAEQIALLVSEADLTPKERATNIKLMLEIFSVQLGLVSEKKNLKEIPNSGYEEVSPPLLSTTTT